MRIRLREFKKFPNLKLRYVKFDALGHEIMIGGKYERVRK
jgi:hypothetical protein